MAVFREITLPWDGEEYTVVPKISILRRCEQKGLRFTRLLQSFQSGEPEIGALTLLISELLQEAGADVTEDDVFAVMMGGDEKTIERLALPAIQGFIYEPDEKKPKAHKKK
jgi:hypothetical protein